MSAVAAEPVATEARHTPGPRPQTAIERRTWGVKEVAEFLGVSERTVWRWYDAGDMPKAKKLPGRTVRWASEAILRWFDKQPTA